MKQKIYQSTKKYNGGFTLLELIVVIAIIAILSAISIAYLTEAKNRGNDAAKIQAISDIRKALQSYAVDNAGFPPTSDLLVPKYIASVNSNIYLYEGTDNNGNNQCVASVCPSYHLAVSLQSTGSQVLRSDANLVTTGTTLSIDGTKDNCFNGTSSIPSLCYDVTP